MNQGQQNQTVGFSMPEVYDSAKTFARRSRERGLQTLVTPITKDCPQRRQRSPRQQRDRWGIPGRLPSPPGRGRQKPHDHRELYGDLTGSWSTIDPRLGLSREDQEVPRTGCGQQGRQHHKLNGNCRALVRMVPGP